MDCNASDVNKTIKWTKLLICVHTKVFHIFRFYEKHPFLLLEHDSCLPHQTRYIVTQMTILNV
jgi:hypothetical protein